MSSLDTINKYILEKVKSGAVDKDMAVQILKELNKSNEQKTMDIALIGMACRFPGAKNINEYWQNIAGGKSLICQFPEKRIADTAPFLSPGCVPDNQLFFEGGFLDEIDKFDAGYFRLSPREASLMDPYQRLFLETTFEAIEDSGYGGEKIYGTDTGVFIGTDHTHKLKVAYTNLVGNQDKDMLDITGSCTGILASRISYILNLIGPSLVVDTACSSGLVALHYACQALKTRECLMAIAGGINIFLYPLNTGKLESIESGNSSIGAFDKQASGTVWGEGVASLLLKPLKNALADGDNIHAVIRGSAVNNDGASNGITAPSADAQKRVIIKAWENSGIDPGTISYIETHGTGTILGDPIEIKGLKEAFEKYTDRKQFCGIGSVKTNIGHTVGVSGMASLIKVVLALKNKRLPPSINFSQPNPYIDFSNSPVYLNDILRDWTTESLPRRAGVTALGFSGTNCHVVMEEAMSTTHNEAAAEKGRHILTLSARSLAALKELIRRYSVFLSMPVLPEINDICYTANTGRKHWEYRIAFAVNNLDDLKEKIRELETQMPEIKSIGEIPRQEKERLNKNLKTISSNAPGFPDDICSFYCKGADINWNSLYINQKRKRVSIPVYPFEKKRHWVETPVYHSPVLPANTENSAGQISRIIMPKGRADNKYTKTEQTMASIWGEALGFREIDVRSSFYDLGGDSILGMKIVNIVNRQLAVPLEVSELFSHPSIEELSVYVDSKHTAGKKFHEIIPVTRKDCYPLSSAQKRVYILNYIEGEDIRYNLPLAILLEGKLDSTLLEETFRTIIKRHEPLRTSFAMVNDEPVQIVSDHADFFLERITAQDDLPVRAVKQFVRPFNLGTAPLFRAGLIKTGENKHLLLVDMHHIISDGTSMVILIKELINLYQGLELPGLKIQYKDFAAWQNEFFKSAAIQKQQQYWMHVFKDAIPVLNLPADYPRPAIQKYEGDRICFHAGTELFEALNQFALETMSTKFMIILAAFYVLLYKYTGQEDIVIGSPIVGRNHPDLDNIIGMFINTLAIRNFPEPHKTFFDFLKEVRENLLEGFANQDYQFEQLVEKLDIPRNLSRNPLFDVMVLIQPMDTPEMEINGLRYIPYPLENKTSKFDMTLQAVLKEDGIRFELEYCTHLFKKQTMERLAEHFLNILGCAVKNGGIRLCDIELLSGKEKQRILKDFNHTATAYPAEATYNVLFEEQAAKTPHNQAVSFEDTVLTYRELDESSNSLAFHLRQAGVKPDTIVGILSRRSVEMIIALLAVLKSGAAYLPIDPEYPADRIRYMLDDSKTDILLTHPALTDKIPFYGKIINLDDRSLYNGNKTKPETINKAADLAYVIYTSGSTGQPKGVMLTHKGLNNFIAGITRVIDFPSGKNILALTTVSFDIFVLETLLPLTKGLKVVLVNEETQRDSELLKNAIVKNTINLLQMTPSRMQILLNACGDRAFMQKVDVIMLGGEALPQSLLNEVKKTTCAKVYNMYGPTETTVWSTVKELTGDDVITIGTPIANTGIYIVDKCNRITPIGIPGELCIAGDGLASGYLNKPELTKERFVPNPYGDRLPDNQPSLMYRTGDLARWTNEGEIEFLGRIDHQVKIRGYRIELGEIENTLLAYESIRETAVVKRCDTGGIDYLCAYMVADKRLTVSAIREHLAKSLPEYMIPASFVQLERMPLTANGKIDKKALPLTGNNLNSGIAYKAPENDKEKCVAEVFAKVLGAARVGREDNFFSLGGDSIRAIQVSGLLKKYDYKLEMRDLYQYQIVKEISKCMKPVNKKADNSMVQGTAALVPFQEWLISKGFENIQHYNLSFMLFRKDGFDENIVGRVFDKILEHHDALRMVYHLENGVVIQENRGSAGRLFDFKIFDLKYVHSCGEKIKEEADKLQASMNLTKGQLVKLGLFKTGGGDHLLITIHQLVIDHVSWRILFEDFTTGYLQAMRNNTLVFQDKTSSYLSWIAGIKKYSESSTVSADMAYWKTLEDTDVFPIPTDNASGENTIGNTRMFQTGCLSEDQTQILLKGINKGNTDNMNAVLLAALGMTFKEWSGHDRLLINIGGHGREEIYEDLDISRTVGRFTVLYPVIIETSFPDDVIKQVEVIKTNLNNVPGKGISYGVLKYLTPKEKTGGLQFNLHPEVAFSYMGQFDNDVMTEVFSLSDMPVGDTINPFITRPYTLNIVTMIARRQLQIRFDYSINQYTANTIIMLTEKYKTNLQKILDKYPT